MSGALFDPLTILGEMLLKTDIETLRSLYQVTPELYSFFIPRIYPTVNLRNEAQCLDAFLSFAKLDLGASSKFRKLRVFISHGDTTKLQAALKYFLKSHALEFVEVKDTAGRTGYPEDLFTLIGEIVSTSTAARPLTVVYEGIRFIPYEFILRARHVELKMSNLDPFGTHPPSSQEWPLKTLSFTLDAGKPTFEALFIRAVKFPDLTHLLLNIKPSEFDAEVVDESLLTVMENSQSLEELVIIFEPVSKLDTSYVAHSLDALSGSLSSLSACHPYYIRLHMVLRCTAYHAFHVLDCMKTFKGFSEISVSISCREEDARLLLKHGYFLFASGGENTSFRIDRIVIRRSQRKATVYGSTVQDKLTHAPSNRDHSHYKTCPWIYREEFEGFSADWVDVMIPAGDL
ncbi:hypothetical protein CVT26_004440 [Gymnopilus dilepis]|uniref:FBD domain-containing protein n=1 Tax=Gymnopilus dilepis TaxID=231916 RepID=A0A409W6U4_9AGAR|nr:hypothetical protein CVT26_004440 [Gymnopilus dilepis]